MDFKFEIEQMADMVSKMQDAFRAVQQPRSDFALEHFVVGQHLTESRQFMQCVTELQIKYHQIRRGLLQRERTQLEIVKLKEGVSDPYVSIELQLKVIDLEELELGLLGGFREFRALYSIFRGMPSFSYEQLQEAEQSYWNKRLTYQAELDLQAVGRIGVGNLEALHQIELLPRSSNLLEASQ